MIPQQSISSTNNVNTVKMSQEISLQSKNAKHFPLASL